MVRCCCVNCQCRGVLLIWIIVGQGPTALTVDVGGVVRTFFLPSIISHFFLPLSGRRPDIDGNTVSKGRKAQNNQPTNHGWLNSRWQFALKLCIKFIFFAYIFNILCCTTIHRYPIFSTGYSVMCKSTLDIMAKVR